MSHGDVTMLVSAFVSLAPGILALLLGMAAYINGFTNTSLIRRNTARLDHLENGGGNAKIDTRLAQIGLVDRRDAGALPTPIVPASAPAQTAPAPAEGIPAEQNSVAAGINLVDQAAP